MTRMLAVEQREEVTDAGDAIFWYVLKGRNGKTTAVSEMFPTRANAIRGARRFIAEIAPVPVKFTYCTGPVPPRRGKGYRTVTEVVR